MMPRSKPPADIPGNSPSALQIELTWRLRTDWRVLPLLRRAAHHVASAEGFRSGQLSVVVVGARAMTTLHDRFHNLPTPTDVLTFDLGSDSKAGLLDGEIYVCADVALRRAGGERRRAQAELALYVTHGILHLAGYDDHTPTDFQRMHQREDELLTNLGLGPIFSTDPRA